MPPEVPLIEQLKTQFTGELFTSDSPGYDEARRLWNGMIDRRPAAIARCTSPADVQQLIRFAAEHDLYPAVRAGGHNVAGLATVEGGLVIDVSRMKKIDVDVASRTVTAEAGLLWSEFDAATAQHGLATTGGVISTTGIAGLTLGGGIGWLMGRFGLACDNTIAYEIVLADSRAIRATATEHPDLFWALRGGGGNFGVVTSLTYRLYPLTQVVSGLLLYPLTEGAQVLRCYRDVVSAGLPDELILYSAALCTPDGTACLAIIPAWCGDDVKGARPWIDRLKTFGTVLADMTAEMPYPAMQQMLDAAAPYGIRSYWKSNFMETLPDEAIDRFIQCARRCPSPRSVTILEHAHGAAVAVSPEATAFPSRNEGFDLAILGLWQDPAEDTANIKWTREMFAAMRPWAQRLSYVNAFSEDDGNRLSEAFGSNLPRLSRIKADYDPGNRFRHNHNIQPAVATTA